ncbi:MAG: hypothetical protein KA099_08825 [Alphaproteobacteria bacterium]|nr:hypothetical protein [Alphaproteobacteria bacterium]MBP7758168.1 hypothetical protein [Alphaproteobacteria bacterium]MBP7761399.1 hypothetical protein [Alphaproteobacteria bacterium]MBP7905413.1 hypothetical protein [Alphaproteobacteria bacterium]
MDQANKPKSSNDDTSRKAFSPKLDELKNALAVLYISKNMSGRNKFLEKWPDVAGYLFGPELIDLDTHGVQLKDYALRAALELKAEECRLDLKTTLAEVEEKSVKSGSLIFDYVASVIDRYGPHISRMIFAENIIERVKPGLLAKADEEKKKKEQEKLTAHQQEEEAIRRRAQSLGATVRNRPSSQEVKAVSNVEIPDEVRPIDAGSVSSPQIDPRILAPEAPIAAQSLEPVSAQEPAPGAASVSVSPMVVLSKPEKGFCKTHFNRVAAQLVA